jgi:bifunctional non-homologous end joining protein LigD
MRKANLDRLSARRPEGIFVAPFEQGEIGPDLFRAACKMGLEGLVSKRRDRAYRGGRCTHWIKVKNPGVAGDESRGGNRLVAVTERSTIASETVALTFDTSETAVTALRAV